MLRYVVFFLVIVATLSPNQSTAQTVPDSIRMEISVLSYEETSPDGFWFNCGSFVIGTWPNDAARILDREVGYSAYQLVATEGMYIPRGYGAIDPATLPEGYLGHHSQMGGAGSMPAHSKDLTGCSQARANAEYVASGAEVLLNARPFRVTEWYAVYNVDAGTPVAGFVWEQTEGLTIKFDGSFQHSREIETTGSVPVESYAWDLGNGESSTSDAFSFTYEEPGTYAVTLEVTDDDGQTAQFTQNVKVRSAVLEYRAYAEERSLVGDTLEVYATITNTGVSAAVDVKASKGFYLIPTYPEPSNFATRNAQSITLLSIEDTTIARIEPNETVRFHQFYEITKAAEQPDDEIWHPVAVDWRVRVVGVAGSDENGLPAETVDYCEKNECSNVARIDAPQLEGEMVVSTVDGEGNQAYTGLRRHTSTLFPKGIFKHLVLKDLKSVCNSGCTDMNFVVTDPEGNPVEGATIDLSTELTIPGDPELTTSDGKVLMNSNEGSGFFCDLEKCGSSLTTAPSDSDGKIFARYWLPPVISPVAAKVTAEVSKAGFRPQTIEKDLDVLPSPVDFGRPTYAPSRLAVGGFKLMRGVQSVADFADLPAWCKWAKEELLVAASPAAIEGEYLSATRSVIAFGCGEIIENLFDPILRAEGPPKLDPSDKFALLDAFNKALLTINLVWFQSSFDVSLVGTAKPKPALSLPYIDVDSDFTDAVKAGMQELAKKFSVLDIPPSVSLRMIEASHFEESQLLTLQAHTKLFLMLQSTDADHIVDFRKVIDLGYDPRLFLPQNAKETTTAAEAGPTDVTVDLSGGPGKRLAADDTTFQMGHVLMLDTGEVAERIQVVGIEGSTLQLSTPLKFAHAAGVPIVYVDSLAVGPPDAPLLISRAVSGLPGYSTTPTLKWSSRAPATAYTVEVATDTTFTDPVQTFADVATDSLQLDVLQERQLYYVRVAGENQFGQGEWSDRFALFTGAPLGDNFAEAIPLPGEFYEGVAAWHMATTAESGETLSSCGGSSESLWFSFTPAVSGTYAIESFKSNFDTELSVWTGSVFPLSEITCNDDYENGEHPTVSQSYVEFEAEVGTTYHLRVSGSGELEERVVMLSVRAPTVTAVESQQGTSAEAMFVEAWPNPTNGVATVAVSLAQRGALEVAAFDALGRRVAVLADATFDSGRHEFVFDTSRLPVGHYYVVATGPDDRVVKSVAVLH